MGNLFRQNCGRWGDERALQRLSAFLRAGCGFLLLPSVVVAQHEPPQAVRDKLQSVLESAGEPRKRAGESGGTLAHRRIARTNHERLRREVLGGKFYAALVSAEPASEFEILQRYRSPVEMAASLRQREAVVEVWSYAAGGEPGRRLRAAELAVRATSLNQSPTFLTATYFDSKLGVVKKGRIEFGTIAPSLQVGEARRYRRDRERRDEIRRFLGARNGEGVLSAGAQWKLLRASVKGGRLSVTHLPASPQDDRDLFVACECEVGADGQIARVVRVYRASQVSHQIVGGAAGLSFKGGADQPARSGTAVRQGEGSGVPLPGRDVLEVRMIDRKVADSRRWNRVLFGEPWVLRECGLAQLGLISAHLENQRKDLAWRKSNLDRFAEPIFAGLNIGGGIAGATTPLGEVARLAYNVIVTRSLTPSVPSSKELEDLFRFVAAKARHATLARRPGENLSASEVKELRSIGAKLAPRDVEDSLRVIAADDLRAMLAFPTWQNMDQKYRLYVDILTDLLKVTGDSESGILKDLFNNSRLGPNGEFNITSSLAIALGQEGITPLSGVSLQDLAQGDGPERAWLQFLNVTVDLRALANSLSLFRRRDDLDRELQKPFGHAPSASDLAAFEFRVFGYPTLFWYKRGLLKEDLAAYRNDFAYGVFGTRVVKRLSTREDFMAELRAGRLMPIGFARIPEGLRRAGRESNLPVFGYRIPSGKDQGQIAILIYGLKAYRAHSAFMRRELERFRSYQRMLKDGGVITKVLEVEGAAGLTTAELEPKLNVGQEAVATIYRPLLQDLLEYQRLLRLSKWGVALNSEGQSERARLESILRGRGVAVGPGQPDPLELVDPYFSSYVYRAQVNGQWRRMQAIHIPSVRDLARGIAVAEIQRQRESVRRRSAGRVKIDP